MRGCWLALVCLVGQGLGECFHKPTQEPSKASHNPDGTVVELTSADFESKTQSEAWFLKFYAPWCGHCKNLAPVIDEVALDLQGVVNVGRVDCTSESSLCESYGVRGYPTLKFKNDGQVHDYKNPRNRETITKFCSKVISDPLPMIKTEEEINNIVNELDVAFLWLDDLPKEEGEKERNHIQNLSKHFISSTSFHHVCDDSKIQDYGGRGLVVVREGQDVVRYEGNDFENFEKLVEWGNRYRYPLLPELSSHNGGEILGGNRRVVMLVVTSVDQEKDSQDKNQLKQVAREFSQLSKEEVPNLPIFCWLNGEQWSAYVSRNYLADSLPYLVVVDPSDSYYYDTTVEGKKVKPTAEEVKQFLKDIEDGKIEKKTIGNFFQRVITHIQRFFNPMVQFLAKLFAPLVDYLLIIAVVFGLLLMAFIFYMCTLPDDDEPTQTQPSKPKKE
eukprot:Lithocolla_globosa_v1_NODE_4674_length_1389_cov_7.670915.p1 type:complete len:444 gc:universal NODE_4674_length_1389_cov_7.670915:53-1384(+)